MKLFKFMKICLIIVFFLFFCYFRSSFFSKNCVETGATNIDTLCNWVRTFASFESKSKISCDLFSLSLLKKIELIMRNEKSTNWYLFLIFLFSLLNFVQFLLKSSNLKNLNSNIFSWGTITSSIIWSITVKVIEFNSFEATNSIYENWNIIDSKTFLLSQ